MADGTLHFYLLLVSQTSANREVAICLDATPSYTDMDHPMRGVVSVEYRPHPFSDATSSADYFDVALSRPVQAGALCHYLLNVHHLDLYEWAV